jgi:hypothetical protein
MHMPMQIGMCSICTAGMQLSSIVRVIMLFSGHVFVRMIVCMFMGFSVMRMGMRMFMHMFFVSAMSAMTVVIIMIINHQ